VETLEESKDIQDTVMRVVRIMLSENRNVVRTYTSITKGHGRDTLEFVLRHLDECIYALLAEIDGRSYE
jgi:hypothetical protein